MKALLRLMGSRLPRIDGEVAAAVHAKTTLRRDAWGVTYVEAENDHDAFFGIGYAHGQDRGFRIELFQRVGRGTASALVGKDLLEVDRLSRRIGFRRSAEAQLKLADPQTRADFEAFAEGVNAGRAATKKPHEMALVGGPFTPFEAVDIFTVLQFFAFALSSNWDAELARLQVLKLDGLQALLALEYADPALLGLGAAGTTRLIEDAELLEAAERFAAGAAQAKVATGAGGASNNWVLAPSRTATGRPLFACDPHLGPAIPAPWYLAHVRTPRWALSGAFFPGQPLCSFGHNERVAWGLTAGHGDNTDLFVEKLGADGRSALYDGAYVPCEARDEVIAVKGAPDVVETVLTTRNGPLVTPLTGSGGAALSMRATWMAPRPILLYQLYRAASVAEARAQLASHPTGSENRLLADVSSTIAWQLAGELPVRKKGHGLLPAAGWERDCGWEPEPLPFAQMPHAIDPPSGFLATANAAPPGATGAFLGADWLDSARHRRLHQLLDERRDWTVESTLKLQLNRFNIYWPELKGPLLAALTPAPSGGETAARLLESWDGVVAADSPGAAVFELLFAEVMCRTAKAKAPNAWRAAIGEGLNALLEHGMNALRRTRHLVHLIVTQPEGFFPAGWREELRLALVAAQSTLVNVAGTDPQRWAWGRVRPVTLMHAVGKVPVLKHAFNVGPLPFGGDGSTLAQGSVPYDHPLGNAIGIPNLRMVLDVGNWGESRWVVLGGQSGNPLSPHYANQVPLFQSGQAIAIAWEPEAVKAAARATLSLMPSR